MVEHLVAGRARDALREYAASGVGSDFMISIAARMVLVPSLAENALSFLEALSARDAGVARVHSKYGTGLIATHRRAEAQSRYRRAVALDPSDSTALTAVERLGTAGRRGSGWTLPFALGDLFARPSGASML